MENRNLHTAKRNKNDEFYTQLIDIENELKHYEPQFKNKVIYCNCDSMGSNFYKYFKNNFTELGLKLVMLSGIDNGCILYDGTTEIVLEINGDFRSDESIELLKQADIVVTNPPFSLFREYIAQLVEYDKQFIVMGNNNAITYKEIFPLIKENKLWLGYNANKTMEFGLSDHYEKWNRIGEDGMKYGTVPAISWFTNMDVKKRHEDIFLYKDYKGNEDAYPKYDNYNAIEVSRVKDIPRDYEGVMGVPITFLTKYNPNQFEILGMTKTPICFNNDEEAQRIKVYEKVTQHGKTGETSSGNKINDCTAILLDSPPKDKVYYTVENKEGYLVALYARILIKNKKPETKRDAEN